MLQLHFAFAQQTPRAFPFILLQLFFLSFLCSAEVRSTWSVMKICVVKTVPAQLGQCRSCRSQLLSSKKTAFYFAVDTFFFPFPGFLLFFFSFLLFLLHSPSALAKISGTTVQPQQALRPLRSLPLCICTWVEQLLFFCSFSSSVQVPCVLEYPHLCMTTSVFVLSFLFVCLFREVLSQVPRFTQHTQTKKNKDAVHFI